MLLKIVSYYTLQEARLHMSGVFSKVVSELIEELFFGCLAFSNWFWADLWFAAAFSCFPTCQVRVVRFYHSCSPPPPPRLAILLLLLLLLRQHLLHHLCLHFHVHCCLASSSPSSSPTSELSVHRWTSTWDLPSSVGTAGPQPGTFPAQWAPLDLNLGPAQLSVHRWTSTWDLPTSVCTAGPQKHGNQF